MFWGFYPLRKTDFLCIILYCADLYLHGKDKKSPIPRKECSFCRKIREKCLFSPEKREKLFPPVVDTVITMCYNLVTLKIGVELMIEFTNVVKTYAEGNDALRGVSMQIEDGEFAFLVGPSGSGKSTIIKLINGELKPTSGAVHVNGYSLERIRKREIPYLRRTVGVVFQDFRLIDTKTVYENVAFAMRVVGAREREIRERVPYVLELVGLETKEKRHPSALSGGEQQRLAIARALVNNPSTIIADEPTGNLDPARSIEIMSLLQEINNLGTTVLVVTHELELVERMHKRVIAIDEGLVISDGLDGEEQ